MAIKTKLTFTLPDSSEAKYSLQTSGTYHIGTSEDCEITLADSALEPSHAMIVPDETNEARWFLQHLADGSIEILEDGTSHLIGHTNLLVTMIPDGET